jgi:transcriptional regulator with XRE-family HTH domain
MSFGKRLKKLRLKKGLTQAELAKMLNIGESTISFYEAGKREPDYEMLNRFADLFNVSVDYMLGRTDFNKPIETIAAHRVDDPMDDLPEEAHKSLDELSNQIKEKSISNHKDSKGVDFIRQASKFLLGKKILSGKADFISMAKAGDKKVLQDFVNAIIERIEIKDRRVTAIHFIGGITQLPLFTSYRLIPAHKNKKPRPKPGRRES